MDASLSEPLKVEARLYTLTRGVLPVFSVSTYCRGEPIHIIGHSYNLT